METIENNLKSKNLSTSSISLYLRNLKKLNNDEEITNFNFLKKPEEVLLKLDKLKDNTKRAYLISIVSVLNSFGDKYEKLQKQYYKYMLDISNKIKAKPTDEMTETQKENWINWEDVLKRYDELFKSLGKSVGTKKTISDLEYNKLLKYVVLSIYVLIPPRRTQEWLKMKITFNSDTNDNTNNYLDVEKKQFIFNVFKTAKKDGQLIIDIPDDLMKVLNLYIKYHPLYDTKNKINIPFLVFCGRKPFDKVNTITRFLNKIFEKKISASMLRHIYLSSKYGDIMKEQQEDSKLMSHSMATQKDYIKTNKDMLNIPSNIVTF
jgi:integrase